jgi:hypothetical protein
MLTGIQSSALDVALAAATELESQGPQGGGKELDDACLLLCISLLDHPLYGYFSAEYGRSAGGVLVAAGKTGANQVHGSVYDYLKNDKLNANSWANNRNNVLRGRQRHNEYGFTASGPVYLPKVYDGRNQTFFFFNWEDRKDRSASFPKTSPRSRRSSRFLLCRGEGGTSQSRIRTPIAAGTFLPAIFFSKSPPPECSGLA